MDNRTLGLGRITWYWSYDLLPCTRVGPNLATTVRNGLILGIELLLLQGKCFLFVFSFRIFVRVFPIREFISFIFIEDILLSG